ncbi:MAG: hypothetical protein N2738_01790 [Thermodesulfovibrionales bacterium]|nr:hypothetical protein [Thermodesulfovibrionales bacterium]
MPKSILLIAYNYPPLISPQSLRWFYLSRELSKLGYKIDVLTISMPSRFQDMKDFIPPEINVYRIPAGPFYYLTYKYSREDRRVQKPMTSDKATFDLWKYIYSLYLFFYRFGNSLLIPNLYTEWLPFAYIKGLSLIQKYRYDLIISSSEPAVCHIVAYLLKKKFNTKWLADYGDPWIYPIQTHKDIEFKKSLIRKLEARLLKKTDFITVTAEGTKKLYIKDYDFLQDDKVQIITQGYCPDVFNSLSEVKDREEFVLTYCGSFYKKLRDPSHLFSALKELTIERLKVKIAGRINEFEELVKGQKIIEYNGFISHIDSIRLEKNSTVLLFISNATDTQIPGKIYEYIGAKRPILSITDNLNDPSSRLIRDTNRGIVVNNDKNEIKNGIIRLYQLWQEDRLDSYFDLKDLEEYTWRSSAKKISEVINKI